MIKILRYSKRLSIALLLILMALMVLPALPAYAIADPDSPPQVSAVYVYEFDDGSVGVLIDYYLDYTAPFPDETASEAYLAVFVDIDGTTQLKSVAPYTFVDSGYGRGLVWIPFTAAEASTAGLTSTSIALYRVWLTGNPGMAWAGDPPKTITTIDQWVSTSVPETLASRILYYADVLELAWTLDMVESTADGNKLTAVGSSYFENVIAGCRTLAPAAFSATTSDPNYMSISYNTAFGATATSGTATIAGSPVTLSPSITLVNPDFEISDPPMGWTLTGAGATFTRSTTQVHTGTYSGLLTRVGADCYIAQSVDPDAFAGTTVTFGMWVYATVANRARIALDDDVGVIAYSAYHSGVPGWEWLTVPYAVAAAATQLTPRGYVDTGNTLAYFDDSVLILAANTINTGATTGTITIDLAQWTSGDITDDTGTLFGGPTIDLYPGVNTITVTAAGTFTIVLEVVDTATIYKRSVEGTGFDLTDLATIFGMSRWMLSGLVWMFITIIVCAAAYVTSKRNNFGDDTGASKAVTFLLVIMLIAGNLLGLLHPLVTSFAVVAIGAFIGYILFFRSETLHKGMMFMIWMFVITSIAGNIAASGQSGITATRLTAAITSTESDSIPVASTVGFPDAGIILIGDEQITYPDKDATHFLDTTFNDIVRGSADTDNVSHAVNASVRTKESYLLNASIDYKIARITDSAGALAFIAMPILLLDLVMTFFKLPLEFLGTDLAILTYLWMVVAVGMIVGFVIALVGGRRV